MCGSNTLLMNYVKAFFTGQVDSRVHSRFTRYSKGVFAGPVLTVKNSKTIRVSASADYVNILGSLVASSGQSFNVSGKVVSKEAFDLGLGPEPKRKGGLYTLDLKRDLSSSELAGIYSTVPYGFALLNLAPVEKTGFKLSVKKGLLPKPGSAVDGDFCKAALDASALDKILSELLFDLKNKDFKEAKVSHQYVIESLVAPDEIRKDPVRFRTEAKRKGKVKRTLEVDGVKTESEADLLV